MRAPCKGCLDRKLLCHSYCAKYKAFQEQQEAIYDDRLHNVEYVDATFTPTRLRNERNKRKLKGYGGRNHDR